MPLLDIFPFSTPKSYLDRSLSRIPFPIVDLFLMEISAVADHCLSIYFA